MPATVTTDTSYSFTLSLNHPIFSKKSFPIFATILRIYFLVHICNTERDIAASKPFFRFSATEICSAILEVLGWRPNTTEPLLQTSDPFT